MKKINLFQTIILIAFSILPIIAFAQTESDNDGSFNVSNQTFGGSYIYPISKNTIDGFPINVNLRYNENVMHTAFLNYNSRQNRWYKLSKALPEWFIGVNGFAVQSFSNKIKFQSWSYQNQGMNDNCFSADESGSYFNWLIDGYDFNNRMKELDYPDAQDIIKILKDDGSVLELRNPIQRKKVSSEFSDSLYTGKYYEHSLNTNTFAIVEYDTVNLASNSLNIVDSARYNAVRPRKVRLYQGDGLEYVFREVNVPYGRSVYKDNLFGSSFENVLDTNHRPRYSYIDSTFANKIVKPTIFYLEEINSELRNLVDFKRDKHYPNLDSTDIAPGRARILEFAGHKLSYGDRIVTLETFGRTYKLNTGAIFPALDSAQFNKNTLQGNFIDLDANIEILQQEFNQSFLGKEFNKTEYETKQNDMLLSYQGVILGITDPENRKITFDYSFNKKIPELSLYQSVADGWFFYNTYLNKITQPKRIFEINANKTSVYSVVADELKPESMNPNFSNIITDYTVSNNIKGYNDLRKEKSIFTNIDSSSGYYNRRNLLTKIFFDGSTPKDTILSEWNFRKYTAACFIVDTGYEQIYTLSMQIPEKTVQTTSSGILTNYVKYGHYLSFSDPSASSYLNYAPIFSKQFFKKNVTDNDQLIQYQKHNYSFARMNTFGTGAILDSNYSNIIARDTTISYFPTDTSRIFSYEVSHYFHLPLDSISGVRADTLLLRNETRSANDSIWKLGNQFSVERFKIKTTSGVFIKPPLFYLEVKNEILDSNKTLLGGKINTYQLLSNPPSSLNVARRGALLRDSVIFRNNEKVLANIYKYRGGTYKNFVTTSVNNLGQTTRNYYKYSEAGGYPTGYKFYNTNANASMKLFKEYPEYESPVGSTSYVRKYKFNGTSIVLDSTSFTSFKEKTFYGQPKSVIDPNNNYAEFQYDKNGRILTEWQPYDFPDYDTRFGARVFNHYCMQLDSVYKKEKITIDTVSNKITHNDATITHPTESTKFEYHAGEVGTINSVEPYPSLADTNKRIIKSKTSETIIIYRSNPNDEMHTLGSMDSIALKISPIFLANNKFIDLKLSVDKFNYEQRMVVASSELSNASSNSSQINKNNPIKEFTFDLTPIKSALMSMASGEMVEFRISSMSPDGYMTILSQSNDVMPCMLMSKFATNPSFDFTHRYEYNDSLNATYVFSKIDDSLHTAQKDWFQTWNSHFGRYYKVRNFNDMNEKNYKNLIYIGGPDSYTRIDSLQTSYNHLGQKFGAYDQDLNFKFYQYTNGELTKLSFTPNGGSTPEDLANYSYKVGRPDTLVPNYDTTKQNFYNYCTVTTYMNANSDKVSNYLDAFGLKRIEMIVSADGNDTTKTYYNYDLYSGNVINVVNTVGDTIKYWYDDFGKLKYKYQKDVGYLSYRNDKYGNLRFSQTQQQAMENKVTYFEYDDMLRVTLSGEAKIDTSGMNLVEPLTNPYSTFKRITDVLDPNKLNYADYGLGSDKGILTANQTIYSTLSPTYPPYLQVDTTNHVVGGYKFQGDTISTRTFFMHPVSYANETALTGASKDSFEDINENPQFVLNANSFDAFPQRNGKVWENMPEITKWDTLLQGTSGYKGKLSITAYRDDANDNYNYVAFKYDARGRITKLVRYTENLGFDGVFYKYNSLNQIISMRSIDPHRQFITWYGYDNDGKLEKVWNMIDSANSGFGVGKLKIPSEPDYKFICLKDSFDIVYTYNKLGQMVKTNFRKSKIEQRYSYNPKGWLDSTIALQNYNLIFSQKLTRDDIGNIIKQVSKRTNSSNDTTIYINDNKYRLKSWYDNKNSFQSFIFDKLGNIQKQYTNADSVVYSYSGNRLVTTTTANNSILKKYNYNYSGALVGISDTNTFNQSVTQKSQWKYNSKSFLRDYTEFDTTGYYLNYNCNSYEGLPLSVNGMGSIWRYKYSAAGTREQKRLLYSPSGDSCQKQMGWVYYKQGVSGETRVVYKGKQTAKDTLGKTGRRVYFWADKYIAASGLSFSSDSTQEIEVQDALGSTKGLVVMTKDLSTTVKTFDYKPYGDTLRTLASLPDDAYIGMELDGERGQYHFNARSYDQKLSRFFAPDLLFEMYPNQSPYSYSANNPVNFKDPSGLAPINYNSYDDRAGSSASINEFQAAWETGRLAEYGFGTSSFALMRRCIQSGGGGTGGSKSNEASISGLNLRIFKITNISREDSDKMFFQLFNVKGFLSPVSESFGKLDQIMQSFHQIVSTQFGLDMVYNMVERLKGNQIKLIGVSYDEMEKFDSNNPKAKGLATFKSVSDMTIRINNEFSSLKNGEIGWESGYYTGNLDESFEQTSLFITLAHELGHASDYLTYGHFTYRYGLNKDIRETSTDITTYIIIRQFGFQDRRAGRAFYWKYNK